MKCFYCANEHDNMKCPMISAYEYTPEGTISRIEFVTFVDFMGVPASAVDCVPPGTTRQ
jgi:hypothetical protein